MGQGLGSIGDEDIGRYQGDAKDDAKDDDGEIVGGSFFSNGEDKTEQGEDEVFEDKEHGDAAGDDAPALP